MFAIFNSHELHLMYCVDIWADSAGRMKKLLFLILVASFNGLYCTLQIYMFFKVNHDHLFPKVDLCGCAKYLIQFKYFNFANFLQITVIKGGYRITGFWNKTSPILGLLLPLSVCPFLSDFCEPNDNPFKSDKLQPKSQEKSDNVFLKHANCMNGEKCPYLHTTN